MLSCPLCAVPAADELTLEKHLIQNHKIGNGENMQEAQMLVKAFLESSLPPTLPAEVPSAAPHSARESYAPNLEDFENVAADLIESQVFEMSLRGRAVGI